MGFVKSIFSITNEKKSDCKIYKVITIFGIKFKFFKNFKYFNYCTFLDMSKTIRKNIQKFPMDVDLIIGVPRSGIIPAYMIALFLNKQVCSLNEFVNKLLPQKGERPLASNTSIKNVLVVDDSICRGDAMEKAKKQIENILGENDLNIWYCAIFGTSESVEKVDYCLKIVERPRLFQWNYLNHLYAKNFCFDMDGVLCADPTKDENDDGEKYLNFIKNAKPLYIPCYEINSIVTSRLEKYRKETEQWLQEHNVKYKNLYMLNLPNAKTRRKLNCHAKFKAKIYSQLENCYCFVESSRKQAKEIAKLSKKQCICVETDECFGG